MSGFLATVQYRGVQRGFGTISFSDGDASIYLRPISTREFVYDYGRAEIPLGSAEHTFDTAGQLRAVERPHISIHDSGKCHVRIRSGPAHGIDAAEIGPLNAFTGAHVGTIFVSNVSALPPIAEVWPDVGSHDETAQPWDVTPPGDVYSIRVSVFVSRNGQRVQPGAHQHREEWRRRADGGRLCVALEAFAAAPLARDILGIGVIGGWNPRTANDPTSSAPLVFVRDRRT
jgi:hypothetical protein